MKQPVESTRQPGSSEDGVLAVMRKFGIPMTRKNYIELAYWGQPPEVFGAELEEELPEQFRKTK
jgi:hypothetical protein